MTETLRCAVCLALAGAMGKDAITVTKGEAVCRNHLTVLRDNDSRVIGTEPASPTSVGRDESRTS